jgi:hypothetical protein
VVAGFLFIAKIDGNMSMRMLAGLSVNHHVTRLQRSALSGTCLKRSSLANCSLAI